MLSEHMPVAKAFSEMGLSFRSIFPDPIEELSSYARHRWVVVKARDRHLVLAIPPTEELETSFWEEWAQMKDGELGHRVLFATPPAVPFHDLFDVPRKPTGLYPKELHGRRWFVVQEPGMFAWGVKNLLDSH